MSILLNIREKGIIKIETNLKKIQKELDTIVSMVAMFPKSDSDSFFKTPPMDQNSIDSLLFELKTKKQSLDFNQKLLKLICYQPALITSPTNEEIQKKDFSNQVLNFDTNKNLFASIEKIEEIFIELNAIIEESIFKIEQIEDYLDNSLKLLNSSNQKKVPTIEYRQTRLIPRSIPRTIERFFDELNLTAEDRYIQEFQLSRKQIWTSFKALLIFIFVPIVLTHFIKGILLEPMISYSWNKYNSDFFLNQQQEKKALNELKNFEDKIYFEQLVQFLNKSDELLGKNVITNSVNNSIINEITDCKQNDLICNNNFPTSILDNNNEKKEVENIEFLQNKKIEAEMLLIAKTYNQQSITLLCNLIGDFFTIAILIILINIYRREISILKAFLSEILYSLGDTTKSFFIILLTDLLVGFHSPKGWEIFIQSLLDHFALPQNEDFVFLCVATFPVLLDTAFKYWIFRYLNRLSPSTVVTYHKMIE